MQRVNELWCKVQSHEGTVGYIPASYVMKHVSGISSLEPPEQPELPPEDFAVRALADDTDISKPSRSGCCRIRSFAPRSTLDSINTVATRA